MALNFGMSLDPGVVVKKKMTRGESKGRKKEAGKKMRAGCRGEEKTGLRDTKAFHGREKPSIFLDCQIWRSLRRAVPPFRKNQGCMKTHLLLPAAEWL